MAQANHKETYLASSITLMVAGALFMLDKYFHFAAHGYGWLVDKSNLLLFAAIISCWSKVKRPSVCSCSSSGRFSTWD